MIYLLIADGRTVIIFGRGRAIAAMRAGTAANARVTTLEGNVVASMLRTTAEDFLEHPVY